MTTALLDTAPDGATGARAASAPGDDVARPGTRWWLGEPRWSRPALGALVLATALLYLVGLDRSGWANTFYAAAVQAGTKSWKAFFFGSFDASSFITVDKPPAALWVMELSARIFGLSSWSLLVPQALEGVASVALVYAAVRRWFGPPAGLLAGGVLALTPVAALMFRFNNPDALLALLLTGAAYATLRAVEDGRTRWLVLVGVLVGTGFITKMLQAFFVVPALGLVYLIAGPPRLGRRIVQLLAGGLALAVASLWWVVAVELVPASDRPYVGGSQDNNLFNLIFGYNGFGRLTGNENGSVGSNWGPTGWNRLFLPSFGGQISWLIPASLVFLAAVLWSTRRAARTDRTRAAILLWGLWLVVSGLMLSYAQGIIHPYYTVALAPAIGALVAIGATRCWRDRSRWFARAALALATAATAVWAYVLLGRNPGWLPALRVGILVAGLLVAGALLVGPLLRRRIGLVAAGVALAVALAGPAAYSLDTVATAHGGAIPSAGPTTVGSSGFGPGRTGVPGSVGARGATGVPSASAGGLGPPAGTGTGIAGGTRPAGGPTGAAGGAFPGGTGTARGGIGGASGAGNLLQGSTPGRALTRLLEKDASRYTWVAAAVGANDAAGYQLATRDPVMAIGGFNGTDPAPSLAEFERDVAQGKVHYFIASGGLGGPGGGDAGGSSSSSVSTASAITSWVEAHFTSRTVDGIVLYDLTSAR